MHAFIAKNVGMGHRLVLEGEWVESAGSIAALHRVGLSEDVSAALACVLKRIMHKSYSLFALDAVIVVEDQTLCVGVLGS